MYQNVFLSLKLNEKKEVKIYSTISIYYMVFTLTNGWHTFLISTKNHKKNKKTRKKKRRELKRESGTVTEEGCFKNSYEKCKQIQLLRGHKLAHPLQV